MNCRNFSISFFKCSLIATACLLAHSIRANDVGLNYRQTSQFYNFAARFQNTGGQPLPATVLSGYYGKSEAADTNAHAVFENVLSGQLETLVNFGMRGDVWNTNNPTLEFRQLLAGELVYQPNYTYEFTPGLQLRLKTHLMVGNEKSKVQSDSNFNEAIAAPNGWVESFAGEGDLKWIWGTYFSSSLKVRPRYTDFQNGIRAGQHLAWLYALDLYLDFEVTPLGSLRFFTGYSNIAVSNLVSIPLLDEIYLQPKAAHDFKRNIYLGVEKGIGRRSWFNTFAGIWGQRPLAGVRANLGPHFKLLAYYSERSYTEIRNQTVGRRFSLGLDYVW